MTEQPVTAEELTLAKESITRSLPALFETTGSTVGTVGSLFLLDQPPEYYRTLPARLESITAQDVFETTKKHLKPGTMLVTVVGDRERILPQIEALEIGRIMDVSADGRPVAAAK